MFCRNCQQPLTPDARFCPRCGASVAFFPLVKDRGAVIVALGILSILIFGPFTGVPGWLMANGDLRDMRAGLIPLAAGTTLRTGRVLNIVGTFCSIVSLIVLFVLAVMAFVFIEMGLTGTAALVSIS